MMQPPTDDIVGIYEVHEALEAVIRSSDPDKRTKLAEVMDRYAEDPDSFYWATGAPSSFLYHRLIMSIDAFCRPAAQSKPRPVFRLVERKRREGEDAP